MASNCSNPDLEDEQFEPMDEGSIPSLDEDEDADDYEEYSNTISDIVSRVMNMDNAPKRHSLFFGRLPLSSRSALSATPCNFNAAPEGGIANRNRQLAPIGDGWDDVHHSSSKMVRSVSTPELSNKRSYNPPTSIAAQFKNKKMPIIRKMNFMDLPRSVKPSSERCLPLIDLDAEFVASPPAKEDHRTREADMAEANTLKNKENICPAPLGSLEDDRRGHELPGALSSHLAGSRRSSSDAFKEPYSSLYPRSGASAELPSSKLQSSGLLPNRHPPSSNPLLRDVHISSCSYFGSKTPRRVLSSMGNIAPAGPSGYDSGCAGWPASRADGKSSNNFLPWSSDSKHSSESKKFSQESQFSKGEPLGLPVKSVSACDLPRNLPSSGSCVAFNLSPNSSIGDSTLKNDSSYDRGDSVIAADSTSDLLDGLTLTDPFLQSALKKLDASFNSTNSTSITNLFRQCRPSTTCGSNLVVTSTSDSISASVPKSSTITSSSSGLLLSSSLTGASTNVHRAEQKHESQSYGISSRACGSAAGPSISLAQSRVPVCTAALPPTVPTVSASVQSVPLSVQVSGTSVETSRNSAQAAPATFAPASVPAAPAPVPAAPALVQATTAPVQVTPVQATPAPVQATPAPVQATPAPVQATPAPVQATPAPVQATPAPVQAIPAPVQAAPALVQATPASVPAPFPCMESLYVNGKQYMKLSLLGRGGSSEVYEVVSLESRAVVAVKVVLLSSADEQMVSSYKNEIAILRQLQGTQRVIKLYDFEETANDLRIVMERGSHDLACVLKNARTPPCQPISPFTVQHYWQGMLLAVQAIHERGIIHSDLKPANFLLVKDVLKLIDFGIASSIQVDMTSVLKDSQAGTFNYMSPESLNYVQTGSIVNGQDGDKQVIKIGTKSDVWSLGCILYNLVYSKTPFQHLTNVWQKLGAISNPKTVIHFSPCQDANLLDTMQLCLQHQPHKRPTIQQLLQHPYLTGVEKNVAHPNS